MAREISREEFESRYANGERDFTDIELFGDDGSWLNVPGVDLSNVYFDQFCGDRINLSDAKLIDAQFFQVSFGRANLSNADFSGSALSDVSFGSANLRGTNFCRAKLRDVDFTMADLEGVNFEDTLFCRVCMPDGSYRNEDCEQIEGVEP